MYTGTGYTCICSFNYWIADADLINLLNILKITKFELFEKYECYLLPFFIHISIYAVNIINKKN